MAQSYEIVNSKTHKRFGRKFDTRKEAIDFIKYLQANTSLKLNWVAKPWPYKREENPTVTASSLPIGEWSPAHAIRRNADGTVDVLREKNSGRRANISEGYMVGGVFHPIRSAADYDPSRVGESKGKKRKAVSKKRALPTSRREYGGDGSRYRNPGEGTYITSTPLAKLVKSLGYSLSKNATDHLGKRRSYRVVGGGRFGATTNYFNSAEAVKKWAVRVAKDRQLFS